MFVPDTLFDERPRYFLPDVQLPVIPEDVCSYYDRRVFSINEIYGKFLAENAPDDVLIEIFRRLHPVDRIHGVSLVCSRWNRLIYSKGIWTAVRIRVVDVRQAGCILEFLQKESVASTLRKLHFIGYNIWHVNIAIFLPKKLPNLVQFCCSSGFTRQDFGLFDVCMPKLRILVFEDLPVETGSSKGLESIFPSGRFRYLRTLFFESDVQFSENASLKEFLDVHTSLEELSLNFYNRCHLWTNNRTEATNSNLRKLSFRNVSISLITEALYLAKNLVFLEVEQCPAAAIPSVRLLRCLEHLHFDGSRLSVNQLSSLFGRKQMPGQFPYHLRNLRVVCGTSDMWDVVCAVCVSCSELRSLSLTSNRSDAVLSSFDTIARSLKELKYLRVSRVEDGLTSVANALSEGALPLLQYLDYDGGVERSAEALSRQNEQKESDALKRLVLRRPKMTVIVGDSCNGRRRVRVNGKTQWSLKKLQIEKTKIWNHLRDNQTLCCVWTNTYDY